jgi:hypothetical protein
MSLGGQIANLIAANYKDGSTGDVPFDPSDGIGEFERRQFLRNQALPMPNQYQQIMGQGSSATPYQRIMGQMPLLQNPYASMSGGYNNFQGGYNPNLYSNAPRAIRQLGFGGGGGGGGSEPAAPSAWSSMTPAQQAAYYAANPTMAAITRAGQGLFGLTSLGMAQNYFVPEFVANMSARAMGYDPANLSYGGASRAEQAAMNAALAEQAAQSYGGASMAEQDAMNAALGEAATIANDIDAASATEGFSVGGGGVSDTNSAGADAASDANSGENAGGEGPSGDGVSLARGGLITNVFGPDPAGPDEGQVNIMRGEYVIKKSAVKKYGTGLLDMINDGKIPAKKMKSLLG